jgi:16S rRNA (guanine527-N7)-methyltransferase
VTVEAGAVVPAAAAAVFGDRLPTAVSYYQWLAGPGIERGLIGPREVERLWHRHLLNCAAMSAVLPQGSSLVDIGSGAGLPGVVIAIARPDVKVICVEPMLRRVIFLEELLDDLVLPNVSIRRDRAEELARPAKGRSRLRADAVTARAVGSIERLAGWAAPLLGNAGALVALKGSAALEEVRTAWPGLRRRGFQGATELLRVDLGTTAPFSLETVGSWPTAGLGPTEAETARYVELAAAPELMALATIVRISRSAE